MEIQPYEEATLAKNPTASSNRKSRQKQLPAGVNLGIDSGLALFKPQSLEAGIKREVVLDYHPLASLKRGKCIEFVVPRTNSFYLALNKSVLRINFSILTEDGAEPKATEKVSCVQCPGYSLFRSCDVELQQKLISPEIGLHYAYKGFLDYICYTPEEHLNSTAQLNLFFKDTPHAFEEASLDGNSANTGLIARHEFTKEGKQTHIISPIANDLMQVEQFLPPNIEIKFRFWPANDDFFIMSGEPETERYKFKVNDIVLQLTAFEVSDQILLRHHQILSKTNARLHYKKSVLKSYQIPADLSTWTIFQFLQGEIPCDMILAFYNAESFVGKMTANPFNAAHNNLIYLSLETEGYQTITFRPDYSKNSWSKEYAALYDPEHGQVVPYTPPVKYRDYPGGYCYYRFALGNRQVERMLRKRSGQSRLIINFSSNLKSAISLLVYARYHTFLEIDLAKNVYLSNECN